MSAPTPRHRLHESTRRAICRALFLFVGLAPLVGSVAWGFLRRAPGHVTWYEERIAALAGVPVKLRAVEHPRPGVYVLHDLRLLDPETKRTLATVRRLDVATAATGLHMAAPEVELAAGALPVLAAWTDARLRALSGAPPRLDTISIERLAATHGDRRLELVRVAAGLDTTKSQPEAGAAFSPPEDEAGASDARRPFIVVRRVRSDAAARHELKLSTRSAGLDLAWFAAWIPGAAEFGAAARFQGGLLAGIDDHGVWRADLADARFVGLDLEPLVARHGQHWSGPVDLELSHATIENGRLVQARGAVVGGPGRLGDELRLRAMQSLGLRSPGTSGPLGHEFDAQLPYDHLAFEFALDGERLILAGGRLDPPGAIATARPQGALEPVVLLQEPARPTSALALVDLLAPPHAERVPLAGSTPWLLGLLPWTERTPAPARELAAEPNDPRR
jgi:hypothetical protein